MNKNKKISISLKRHYKNKQKQLVVKKGLLIAIPFIIAICLISEMSERTDLHISSFKPVYIAKGHSMPKKDKKSVAVPKIEEKRVLSVKEQIIKIAKEENFQYTDYLLRLAYCESRFNPKAINDNGRLLRDIGVFQINEYWHRDISQEQAENVEFATKWTMNMINKGFQRRWMCDKIVKGKTKQQLAYNY